MQTGFRFRCYPTDAQAQVLRQWIGCQRFIYNAKVGEDRYFRRFQRRTLALTGAYPPVDQRYSQFKDPALTPWLSDVPSQILRNGAVRWAQAYSRYFKQLAGRPTIQRKHGEQSVWLTGELFTLTALPNGAGYRLTVGKGKFQIGAIDYVAHRSHTVPASITLSVDAGRWYVSFCTADETVLPAPEDVAAELATWPADALRAATVGVDRGVIRPVCTSAGQTFDFSPVQKRRMAQKERGKRRWQRRMARRTKGSGGWHKARRRVAAFQQYAKRVRHDFAHQTSYRLVSDPRSRLIVFEALRVQAMTRRPKARQDDAGRWLRNGARAKAGLNTGILASAWGKTCAFAQYKALRANKLALTVPPHHTSQECACCGHIHPDNRPTQADFVCLRCGHQANADDNASENIAARGVAFILAGAYAPKARKQTMRLRNKVGTGCAEPPTPSATPRESHVSRHKGNLMAQDSMNLETHAIASHEA